MILIPLMKSKNVGLYFTHINWAEYFACFREIKSNSRFYFRQTVYEELA